MKLIEKNIAERLLKIKAIKLFEQIVHTLALYKGVKRHF